MPNQLSDRKSARVHRHHCPGKKTSQAVEERLKNSESKSCGRSARFAPHTPIEIQIERLSEEAQEALEVASVVGVLFSSEVSACAANLDEEFLENLFEGLSRKHRIVRSPDRKVFPDGTVSARYEFVHSLYREVLYYRQSPRRREALHLRIGQRMEAFYGEQSGDDATALAHQVKHGGDPQRVIPPEF
jgi:predicted ATPase